MSRITVTVELGRFPHETQTACIDLDDDYVRDEICMPLKQSDGIFSSIFDTPPETVQRVRRLRANVAEHLTRDMVPVILKAFAAKDTFNGYTHAENAKFYDPEALGAVALSPTARSGSLRAALTDAQIDAIGLRCSDYDDPSYFRVMAREVEREVAALSAASPPEPAEHCGKAECKVCDDQLGHQAEASSRGAVQRQDGPTERMREALDSQEFHELCMDYRAADALRAGDCYAQLLAFIWDALKEHP